MKILLTGAAGFIGFHTALRLLDAGHVVVGLDNLNSYYDPRLKSGRLDILSQEENFSFFKLDLSDREGIDNLFRKESFDIVIHLGAQAGVRYSIENPFAYIDSNICGTLTILEGCRHHEIQHLIYASSSSVYGANTKQPFSESDPVELPISLYAATKRADELICRTYAHLYRFPITGLRFFTVYGPWGRPDMAYYKFAEAIYEGRPIDVYNMGQMKRDFTYIDDIVDGVVAVAETAPRHKDLAVPHAVYNLGNSHPEPLLDLISILERKIGIEAQRRLLGMQPGDVHETYADISSAKRDYGFSPKISLEDGLSRFVEWYSDYRSSK